MKNFYEQVDANKRRSLVVIFGFIVFITLATYLVTYALGYDLSIVGLALVFSGSLSYLSYYYSDQMILSISNAIPANKKDHFDLYTVTENLVKIADLPMPKLYVIEDTAMNAFATGRDPQHAVVCATTGLIARLNRTELEGVVAHELSHIKNYDTRLMSIVTILVGLITLLGDALLRGGFRRRRNNNEESGQLQAILVLAGVIMAVLSPLIAQLIQLAISRREEYLADASAGALTKYPQGLASALLKLDQDKEALEAANKATAHLYIVNPLNNRSDAIGWFSQLFNTHPPIKDRVKALLG